MLAAATIVPITIAVFADRAAVACLELMPESYAVRARANATDPGRPPSRCVDRAADARQRASGRVCVRSL
jgi:hypothetical protein